MNRVEGGSLMRKTKIVCTIGPASESPETLKKLIEAGMNVARLNFSHGTYEEHTKRIKTIRQVANETGKTVAILLDTKGPEIRTGKFQNGEALINQDDIVTITMEDVLGTNERFSVSYKGLIHDVKVGTKILLDDGLIELEVTDIHLEKKCILAKALNSGIVKDHKGVNIPNTVVNLPGMTEKDANDIRFGIEQDIDFIAASFVRRPSDILEIRKLLEKHGGSHIQIIPKIENQEGVDRIESILEISDGLMVARGDLGVEIPAEDVPLVQKELIQKCNLSGKPVIIATQMLDSMERNPRPTRAEASDVANAIFDGTDAIMLSGETAAGKYPVEAVQTMANIALKAETALNYQRILKSRSESIDMTITEAISQSVTHTAMNLDVGAIITPTESGFTARTISKYRPKAPIIAVTSSDRVNRQLSLVWGVHSIVGPHATTTDDMLELAVESALSTNLCKPGSRVIITAGVPVGESGTTNLLKVHIIGDVIAKGQGIGKHSAYGRATVVKTAEEANERVQPGDILVTYGTDKGMIPAIRKAAGIITETGGLTSHAAIVGLEMGIPVVVGVSGVCDLIKDGQEITIDGVKGDIYLGHASVL